VPRRSQKKGEPGSTVSISKERTHKVNKEREKKKKKLEDKKKKLRGGVIGKNTKCPAGERGGGKNPQVGGGGEVTRGKAQERPEKNKRSRNFKRGAKESLPDGNFPG